SSRFVETEGGEPVVRLSNVSEFRPGDVIERIDGLPAAEASARLLELRASSASSAARNGLSAFLAVPGTRDYVLRGVDGERRDVSVSAADLTTEVPLFPSRAWGPLDDLGHPELIYVDLAAAATEGSTAAVGIAMFAAEGIVFDMRGYPGPNSWRLARAVLNEGSPGPEIRRVYRSPLERWQERYPQPSPPAQTPYPGRVAILTGPTTQSQAEHLVLTLQAANRVTVVGRPSAGANGNITSIALPGGYAQAFTGMIILQPDDSVFHGVGVRVDEAVPIEAADLAAGVDPELERAIAVLAGGG
ncbi:MAG: S41 family peptidase, partial [Myxococcota bacterium]